LARAVSARAAATAGRRKQDGKRMGGKKVPDR
jgi:hypothetical protein